MNEEFDSKDAKIAHAMNQWLVVGLIHALSVKDPCFPWLITEALSRSHSCHDGKLDEASQKGLDLAMEWVWREFTEHAPPDSNAAKSWK